MVLTEAVTKEKLEEIVQQSYGSRELCQDSPAAHTNTENHGTFWYIVFSNEYYIQSLLFTKSNALVIKDVSAYPTRGQGIGRD